MNNFYEMEATRLAAENQRLKFELARLRGQLAHDMDNVPSNVVPIHRAIKANKK